jgi:hypothetical protein
MGLGRSVGGRRGGKVVADRGWWWRPAVEGGGWGTRSEGRRRPRPAGGRRLVWLAMRCEDEAVLVGPTSGSYVVGGSRVTTKGRALSVYHSPSEKVTVGGFL